MNVEDQKTIDAEEVQELREKLWTMTQRLSVLLVVFIAGILVGLIKPDIVAPVFRPLGIQGPAGQLQEEVETLTEKNQNLLKERDTERSKLALMDRDKKELERRAQEAEAKAAACAGQ